MRVFYEKKERVKYISHLDTAHCMQRALKRAGLPVWYTEGFNPHMYLTFAIPLALGYESECEIMDFRLTEDISPEEVTERLNRVLPPGFHVLRTDLPVRKPADIVKAEYAVSFYGDSQAIEAQLAAFLAQDEILVEKKTKKGLSVVDLKQEILSCSMQKQEGSVLLQIVLPAGISKHINPSLLTDAWMAQADCPADRIAILKKRVLCQDGSEFI